VVLHWLRFSKVMINMKKEFGPDYASIADVNFKTKYRANCYCNTVQYEVCSDPVDSKICHCLACQKLHGAPMQWAAIFHKHDVRIIEGMGSALDKGQFQWTAGHPIMCLSS